MSDEKKPADTSTEDAGEELDAEQLENVAGGVRLTESSTLNQKVDFYVPPKK